MVSGVGFIISPAGILKIISLLCMIIGGLIFVTHGDCNESQFWAIAYITTTTSSAALSFVSYALYALDLIKSTTALKVQHIAEITVAYVIFLLLMIVSIVAMTQCSSKKLPIDHIPEPLKISGAILLAIGGTLLFLDWRSKERVDDIQMNIPRSPRQRNNPHLSRKSILV
uniref:Putative conserved plasma membrane protein n=1 Tax=Culex tarsalis TaxID=7177 RepID=A0A1Q3FVT4_CULTA